MHTRDQRNYAFGTGKEILPYTKGYQQPQISIITTQRDSVYR